jgi:hypothetical protein
MVTSAAPELVGDWKKWFFNDGYGLDAQQSVELADRLERVLDDRLFLDDCCERLRVDLDYSDFSRDDIFDFLCLNLSAFIRFLRASGGFEIW